MFLYKVTLVDFTAQTSEDCYGVGDLLDVLTQAATYAPTTVVAAVELVASDADTQGEFATLLDAGVVPPAPAPDPAPVPDPTPAA